MESGLGGHEPSVFCQGGHFSRTIMGVCPSPMREEAMKMIVGNIGRWKEMMEWEYQRSMDVEKVNTVYMKVRRKEMMMLTSNERINFFTY